MNHTVSGCVCQSNGKLPAATVIKSNTEYVSSCYTLTVTSNSGKQTPLPKLLTVTLLLVSRTNNPGHCKMGNAVSAGNGGQVEQDKLDEVNQLKEEYDQLREGKERLSITHLRKSLKRQPSTDKKTLSEEEEKLKQMFADKKDLNFHDFLKWKMQSVRLILIPTVKDTTV